MISVTKTSHLELFNFGLNVALREVLYVGQLKVHLSKPHQDAVSRRFKLLSLTNEVLRERNIKKDWTQHRTMNFSSTCLQMHYLKSAQNSGHPPLQVIPPPVPIVHHLPEAAGGVGAVFPGQTSVLFVDELELRQTLLHLALEGLQKNTLHCNAEFKKVSRNAHVYVMDNNS